MFYSSQLLSKKTALGICWLASHLESKRLKRAQVFEVSIAQSCDSIINPEAPLALRLSGQLLLGVVRIYQRKLTFLETDAKNAIDGLQRKEGTSQNVDLPDGGTAPEMAITLPDNDFLNFGNLQTNDFFPAAFGGVLSPDGLKATAPSTSLFDRINPGTDSLTFADPLSDVFGGSTRWTASEDRMELGVAPADLDRRFEFELERLREAAAPDVENAREAGADYLFDTGIKDNAMGMDAVDPMIMEAPAEDLFVMPLSEGRAPSAAPSLSHGNLTPPSLGLDALPDFGGFPSAGGGPASSLGTQDRGGEGEEASTPSRGRAAAKQKKKVILDVGSDGLPATTLDSEDLRRLLNDRSSLLKPRGLVGGEEDHHDPLNGPFDVVTQSEAARESALYRPTCFRRLAPELLAVFNRAMGLRADGTVVAGRRAQAVEEEEDVNNADNLLLGATSPAPSWGGGFGDGGPAMSDGGFDEDLIENDDEQGIAAAAATGSLGQLPGLAVLPQGDDPSRYSLGSALAEEPSTGGATPFPAADGYARDGFTARTKIVLEHLQHRFAPSPGSKRKHDAEDQAGLESLGLDGLVAGRSRLEACRWFFEALVLRNKGYVDLEQEEPYGEIIIKPMGKLLGGIDGLATPP